MADGGSLPQRRTRWPRVLLAGLLAVLVLLGGTFAFLNSQTGRDQLVRWLPKLTLQSGLGVQITRIEGSLWGAARLEGLKLTDTKGVFLEAPVVLLDWRPLAFLTANRLDIRKASAGLVRVLRKPVLKPTQDDRLLPDYDILVGAMSVDRLVLEAPVAGRRQVLRVKGDADIRAGRAKVMLAVDTLGTKSGDRLQLVLDAEPDRDKLELTAMLDAPEGGVVLGLLGLTAPLEMRLSGDGGWQRWAGALKADMGGSPLANLALAGRDGRFSANGEIMPARVLDGVAARALGPVLSVEGSAGLGGDVRDLTLRLRGPALDIALSGRNEAGSEAIRDGSLDVRLLKPALLFPKLTADTARLQARLAGTLADPLIDWTLTAREAGWGTTRLIALRGAGIVRPAAGGDEGIALPLTLSIARVLGVGETAAPLLIDLKGDGALRLKDGRLTSEKLRLRSTRLTVAAGVDVVFANGAWRIALDGRLPGYALAGLGAGDVAAKLLILPTGGAARVTGDATIKVTRIDNAGLLGFLEGLPTLSTGLVVEPDLSVRLPGLRMTAPALSLSGDGALAANGDLRLTAVGRLRDYGALGLAVTGTSAQPAIRLTLARPGLGIGLSDVTATIVSSGDGWGVVATAASNFGPVAARGSVMTGSGPLTVRIDDATALGLKARGTAVATTAGPLAGRFSLDGDGLTGALVLANDGGVQRIDFNGTAKAATLNLGQPVLVERASVKAALRLVGGGINGSGSFDFSGLERDGIMLDEGNGRFTYAGGRGTATLHTSGTSSVPFSLDGNMRFEGDVIEVAGRAQLDKQQITLSNPARIVHDGSDWVLEPVSLIAGDGRASFSGRYGREGRLEGRLEKLSLSTIAAIWPTLDFDGRVSGRLDVRLPEGDTPRGSVDLTVGGLTRSGSASSSLPINVGLKAELTEAGTVARLIIIRAGKVEGRAQARIGALTGAGSILDRLYAASVTGEARYNGPAQALWGLGGNDAIQVSGPVSLAATISGQVGEPQLGGTLKVAGGRLEATLLGTVIEDVALESRFVGSRLDLTRFSGRAGKGGTVTGTGGIDLSAERSFPMDIRLRLRNAQMLNRDDFSGSGTGTMRIATDEYGGVVSGKLVVDRATFNIGRASTADVPVLNVTERNVRSLGRPIFSYVPPTRWLLNLEIKGDRQLFVSGMGVQSEWGADLRIRGGAYTPELFGRVQLIRGDYDFAGKRFALTKGDVRFQGGYPPDPVIDITAESSNSGFTAQLAINGTATRPTIRFSSVPALPEDEVLSRLLFGDSVTNLSAFEAVQLAGALTSLRGGGGFNPINSVRKGLGIDRLRILAADQLTGRGTAVAAGQYIGRNVYVELATDAQGYTATNIEVSLTRSLSILSQVATLGGTGASLRWQKDY